MRRGLAALAPSLRAALAPLGLAALAPSLRAALAPLGLAALALCPQSASAVELEGNWYVLVHYQDKESPKPDAWRWEDRVWKFEKKGDQRVWTEYPIVVFEDETGRFEALGGTHAARVVAAWDPSPKQLADIKDGLQVNQRGVKTKTLRANGSGWGSSEGGGAASASIVTYSEHWSIGGLPDKPVFARADSMGGGNVEELSGRTEYHTLEVADRGDELRGSFDRDGTRVGTFRMLRSGAVSDVGSHTQEERHRKMMMEETLRSGSADAAEVHAAIARQIELKADPTQAREQVHAAVRKCVEDAYRKQEAAPGSFAPQIESLTRKIEQQLLDQGQSVDIVQKMLAAGEITP